MTFISIQQPYMVDDVWYHPSWFDDQDHDDAKGEHGNTDAESGDEEDAGEDEQIPDCQMHHFRKMRHFRRHHHGRCGRHGMHKKRKMMAMIRMMRRNGCNKNNNNKHKQAWKHAHRHGHHSKFHAMRHMRHRHFDSPSFKPDGNGKLFVSFDMPGVHVDDLKVTIGDDIITIDAVRKINPPVSDDDSDDNANDGSKCNDGESPSARKMRKINFVVALEDVDPTSIRANLSSGVLVVSGDRVVKPAMKAVEIPVTTNPHAADAPTGAASSAKTSDDAEGSDETEPTKPSGNNDDDKETK
eukprot:CAMPEP_0119545966 /NCGR_PEP_ID=MMETSP1352-20130426/566_1 /TAXON_ID=265584 /ORGANISM="Stauroneis constricta, Strain CCMP1120" /LENGTH=297 /DNA_ID=CAMNT_0007590605 /DNA_START=21 /DNA_END=914 /DNA_ORIENTATION=+